MLLLMRSRWDYWHWLLSVWMLMMVTLLASCPSSTLAVTCTAAQFRCLDGTCIDKINQCDGTAECPDRSDETKALCLSFGCPAWVFKCKYGGCISNAKKCDGHIDCVDGSDEAPTAPALCSTNNSINPTGTLDTVEATPAPALNRKCGRWRWRCDSGACVSNRTLCDGHRDCADGSDETEQTCEGNSCPGFTFQCAYGACVPKSKQCDGLRDCADGSDELGCDDGSGADGGKAPPAAAANQCRVVLSPNLQIYYAFDLFTTLPNLSLVEQQGAIQYRCTEGLTLAYAAGQSGTAASDDAGDDAEESVNTNRCIGADGVQWLAPVPRCERRCSGATLHSTSTSVTCAYNGITAACDTTATATAEATIRPGTEARISCRSGYQRPDQRRNDFVVCDGSSGSWSAPPMRCLPTCGWDASPTGTTYVQGGQQTTVHRVPWHVGVYSDITSAEAGQMQQICGGTILTNRLVVTAAHCLWNENDARFNEAAHYRVATGKSLRTWGAVESQRGQQLRVLEIRAVPGYRHYADRYHADVALLVVGDLIEFHSYVMPICVQLNQEFAAKYVQSDEEALVAGWGLSDGRPSEQLRSIYLPTVSEDECRKKVPTEYKDFVTLDKFCGGYLNEGQSVCKGDSGGGLVTWTGDGNGRRTYFLRGVVSSGSNQNGSCDPNMYTVFTNVYYYSDFIRTVMAEVLQHYG